MFNTKTKENIMALSYKLVKNNNEASPYFNKYRAQAVIVGEMDIKAISDLIQRNCTVKKSDCMAVLTELIEVMKDALGEGKKVTLDGLGSFKVGIKGNYADSEAEYSTAVNVKGFRVNFTPAYNVVKTGSYVDEEGVTHVKKAAVADLTKDIKLRQY